MANVAIITDSVACIPPALRDELGITVVPTAIIQVNGQSHIEGEDFTNAEAYALIRTDPDRFVTSAITPSYLIATYDGLARRHSEILFISLSSALSAVSRTAILAADFFRKEVSSTTIRVWDSHAVAGTEGLVVLAVARAAREGLELPALVELAQRVRAQAGGMMLLDTLRYIYRTGRLSKAAAQLASLFNIRPINRLTEEGKIEFAAKAGSRAAGLRKMAQLIARETGGAPLHYLINHADEPAVAESLAGELRRAGPVLSLTVSDFSPVMGYGAGPGAVYVGYHPALT